MSRKDILISKTKLSTDVIDLIYEQLLCPCNSAEEAELCTLEEKHDCSIFSCIICVVFRDYKYFPYPNIMCLEGHRNLYYRCYECDLYFKKNRTRWIDQTKCEACLLKNCCTLCQEFINECNLEICSCGKGYCNNCKSRVVIYICSTCDEMTCSLNSSYHTIYTCSACENVYCYECIGKHTKCIKCDDFYCDNCVENNIIQKCDIHLNYYYCISCSEKYGKDCIICYTYNCEICTAETGVCQNCSEHFKIE